MNPFDYLENSSIWSAVATTVLKAMSLSSYLLFLFWIKTTWSALRMILLHFFSVSSSSNSHPLILTYLSEIEKWRYIWGLRNGLWRIPRRTLRLRRIFCRHRWFWDCFYFRVWRPVSGLDKVDFWLWIWGRIGAQSSLSQERGRRTCFKAGK